MPQFKVRTEADTRDITADRMEFAEGGVRFYSEGRVVAAFSRYLWAEEVVVKTDPVQVQEAGANPPTDTAE
ncbi:hypothetical protein CKQ80_09600 [Pseudomonas moraviensis]|uniref:Uncharacterized protein n=1 Tax=Pseudomonas moraviensis TaxID=321662 RepID=A0A2A2PJB7_9PSED|nr:hypothetical protein [Pseudomonas moraviensis]PAW51040.1 hypothetical protein CKQ68_27435 [Pseudomonas moraviensis]PAW55550.1 hypothetical protein CKQ80_09600 [Pseudomonas moraviensis]